MRGLRRFRRCTIKLRFRLFPSAPVCLIFESVIQRSVFVFFEQGFDRAHDPLNHTNEHEMSLVLFRAF